MPTNSLNLSTPCFDAGSEYCPCALADLGQCVACSILRGSQVCQCGWSGLCVYAEYLRRQGKTREPRKSVVSRVLQTRGLTEAPVRSLVVTLDLPTRTAALCSLPGAFLLVRPPGTPERYNVPLTIMDAGETSISLAVEIKGPKTKALEKAVKEEGELAVTGPFASGIQGLNHLQRPETKKVLAIAKGMGQAAVTGASRYIASRHGYFEAMLGPGDLGLVFVEDLLIRLGATVRVMKREPDRNLGVIRRRLTEERYDVVMSAGSDSQHRAIFGILKEMDDPPKFVWSSNLSMTCGEGICGSCLVLGFRGCKSRLDTQADRIFDGEVSL